MMKLSPAGVVALVQHEGIVPGPYRDSVGVWTFGIGHTAAAGAPDPAKMARGMPADLTGTIRDVVRLFAHDIEKYEAAVRAAVTVEVAQHEFDALVSFHYNTGAIAKADLTKALNRGDRAAAATGFMNWRKPPEIIPRREAEQRLFRDGVYPGGRATVWQVDGAGKVIWKPVATLAPADLLAMFAPTDPVAAWRAAAPAPIDAIRTWLQAMPEGAEL